MVLVAENGFLGQPVSGETWKVLLGSGRINFLKKFYTQIFVLNLEPLSEDSYHDWLIFLFP